jgi:twinkle protein
MRASGISNKHRQRLAPIGSKVVGLFGLNTIPEDATELIITEGEYDAMIVH